MSDDPVSDYPAFLKRLFALTRFGEKRSLDGPRAMNAALADPLSAYRAVVIGGTNGKGSTCAFLEAALRAQGLSTGLYTSPHLVSYRERIRLDGHDVPVSTLLKTGPRVLDAADRVRASFFEASWALAALLFAEHGVDVAIFEVGMGGRLDAANACEPVASAVVSVGLDHTRALGTTIPEIATEKGAIFRAGRPALTTAHDAAIPALKAWAPQLQRVAVRDDLPPLPLPGAHQQSNASLALALAAAIGHPAAPADLLGVRWPGRAERIDDVVIDCAHNPPAAEALAAWIDAAQAGPTPLGPLHLIFGGMADKDLGPIADALAPRVASVELVTPEYRRRAEAAALAPLFEGKAGPAALTVGRSVGAALDRRPAGHTTLVAGSCFLAGEARAHLLGLEFPEAGLYTTAR